MSKSGLSLNWIYTNKFASGYMDYYTAQLSGMFFVADETLITAWKKVEEGYYLHSQTTTWKNMSREFSVYDGYFKNKRIFKSDNQTVTRSNIYYYHCNAALVRNMAHLHRTFSLCNEQRRASWNKINPIIELIQKHKYDEAKAILLPEMDWLLQKPRIGRPDKVERVTLEQWFIDSDAA